MTKNITIGRTKAHTAYYNKAGERVPSTTTVINGNLGWNKGALLGWTRKLALAGIDPNEVRDQAGSVGTITHAMIEADILGVEIEDLDDFPKADVEAAKHGFVSFQHWAELVGFQPKFTELRLVSERLQTGGTLDLVGVVARPGPKRKKWSLIDIKTSKDIHDEHRIQVAQYQDMYREHRNRLLEPYILHLNKETGEFQMVPLGDLTDELAAFERLRDLHDFKKIIGAKSA